MILNPLCVKPPRLFVGREVEHTCYFGRPTLFVVDDVSLADIEAAASTHGVSHVYFGAGGLSRVNLTTVDDIAFHTELVFTIEAVCGPADIGPQRIRDYRLMGGAFLIPISNTGVYYPESAKHIADWLLTESLTQTYVKFDSAHPHVFVVALSTLDGKYTRPEDYSGDTQL